MAEGGAPDAPATTGGGDGLKKALTRKLGPLPVVAWVGIAIVIWWYVNKKNKGTSTGGPQTDPAGNVGDINPRTGYVYGSAEDQAALGSASTGLGTSSDSGTGGSTVAGQYADNNAWAVAAINYLVSIGVDATSANAAITSFLSSQTLTTQQQADVNLAIQRLGAPPSPPEPGTSVPPVVTPPSSSTYATNPPSGFTTTAVGSTAITAKWNAATNATSYVMSWGRTEAANEGSVTVSTTSATAHGLKPNTHYYLRVQAKPAKSGAGFATLSKTTVKEPGTPAGSKGGGSTSTHSNVVAHKVTKDGESFSSIAKEEGYKGTGTALWKYNYTSSPHTAEAKKKIKERGPNLIVHGETVYVPKG